MQLPHGTLASSHRGSADLKELGEAIAKDGLTGYLRVSVFDKSAVNECVIVYSGGKPVMSFASDGTTDRRDPDYRHMDEAIGKEQAIVEVCHLQDKQVKLLQDVYREFAVAPPAAVPAAAAPAKPSPAAGSRPGRPPGSWRPRSRRKKPAPSRRRRSGAVSCGRKASTTCRSTCAGTRGRPGVCST